MLDGLDPRGAEREIGVTREPIIWATDNLTAMNFQRMKPCGEGDLKMAWFEKRLRELVEDETLDMRLLIQSTIDTDSFAITLNDVAQRAVDGVEETNVKGTLVLRERGMKRSLPFSDDAGGCGDASYLCCNYAGLNAMIQQDMWSVVPSPSDQLMAMRLLTTAWAMCGCDFVSVPGLRADIVLQNMKAYTSTFHNELSRFRFVDGGEADVKAAIPALKKMVRLCADQAKLKKHREAMESVDPGTLSRGAWLCAYWAHNECANTRAFGFSF